MTGEVVKVFGTFGFIRRSDGVERYFHRSGVEAVNGIDDLYHGARVVFEEAPGKKGPEAVHVRLAR